MDKQKNNLTEIRLMDRISDPDPVGSCVFAWIRIWSNFSGWKSAEMALNVIY